jgi:FMN phosphatase YigB (HAD superfamily)
MITNGVSETQYGRLEATNLRSYFSNIFISSEMGCQKPDLEYFDIVLDKIKANPSECVIIGDRLESDIRGGLNANIDTIWLNTGNSSNLKNEGSVHPTFEIECLSEIMNLVR